MLTSGDRFGCSLPAEAVMSIWKSVNDFTSSTSPSVNTPVAYAASFRGSKKMTFLEKSLLSLVSLKRIMLESRLRRDTHYG